MTDQVLETQCRDNRECTIANFTLTTASCGVTGTQGYTTFNHSEHKQSNKRSVSAHSCGQQARCHQEYGTQMWNLLQVGQGRVRRQTLGEGAGDIRTRVAVASKAETTVKTCKAQKVPSQHIVADSKLRGSIAVNMTQ